MLQKDQSYPIVKFEILRRGNQGIFGVKFKNRIREFGFVQKNGHILLTSAKSLRILDSLSTWVSVESKNFIFLYPPGGQVSHQSVQQMEEIYHRLLEYLRILPEKDSLRSEKIKYAVCRDAQTLRSLVCIPLDDASSLTDPVSLTILSTRWTDAHEIAHAVAAKYIKGAPPFAYREGFADCFIRPEGWDEFLKNPFQSPSVFSNLHPANFFKAPLPWAQAGGFCKYMVHIFGIELVKDIYEHTDIHIFKGYVLEKTGQSVDELMAAMRRTVFKDPSVLNALGHIREPTDYSCHQRGGLP